MKKIIFTIAMISIVSLGFSQKPEMVPVDGGSFYMGNDYNGSMDEKPEHEVTISSFAISKYEVTFNMFDNFCLATGFKKPDDGGHGRGNKPVINVSWEGAIKFCNWLSKRHHLKKVYDIKIDSTGMRIENVNWDADGYRLPTEAEWEYVARGGSESEGFAFPGSNKLEEVAWYVKNSGNEPHDVGKLKPNELGVYDIVGNAWEWCWDFYGEGYYKDSPKTDPKGPSSGALKVYRGGNFNSEKNFIRVSRRFGLSQNLNTGLVGIRLVKKSATD